MNAAISKWSFDSDRYYPVPKLFSDSSTPPALHEHRLLECPRMLKRFSTIHHAAMSQRFRNARTLPAPRATRKPASYSSNALTPSHSEHCLPSLAAVVNTSSQQLRRPAGNFQICPIVPRQRKAAAAAALSTPGPAGKNERYCLPRSPAPDKSSRQAI